MARRRRRGEGAWEHLRVRQPLRGRRRLEVGRQVGDAGGGRGTGGWVRGGRVRSWWQQPHQVEAAGVEVGVAPRLHHQDSLGVVVEGGDAGRHADSEGEPGDAGETGGGNASG